MKAILIDPRRREVRGIGVELDTLSRAFFDGPNAKIALTILKTELGALVTNTHKRLADCCCYSLNVPGLGAIAVRGRALIIGYERDGQGFRSTEHTVREIESRVRFYT